MIRVRTGSRLHFGLFSLPSEGAGPWLNQEGQPTIPRRQFGGVGLMIEKPGVAVVVERAVRWTATGPLSARAVDFARAYCISREIREAFQICVESAPSEHAGLGTGTQLGLAVASAIDELTGDIEWPYYKIGKAIGRGRRSGIGIHGFDLGGFLVEGGKTSNSEISTLLLRRHFPEEWPILLITPRDMPGMHGRQEIDAFTAASTIQPDDRTTEAQCRLVLLGMLPALAEGDLPTFGEAVYDFNRRVGELFRHAQGGVYANAHCEDIVRTLRDSGVNCVGQSSWGPTVFAILEPGQVSEVQVRLAAKNVTAAEIIVTSACNHGAAVSRDAS